ncbi:hypothetical protein BOX15_Mlig004094g3, partial [Macrostomum lignano]
TSTSMANECLASLGLSGPKIEETMRNKDLTERLVALVRCAKDKLGSKELSKVQGNLIYHTGTKLKKQAFAGHELIVNHIINGDLATEAQVTAACDFCLKQIGSGDLDAFKAACGIGVSITPEDIERAVEEVINKHKQELLAQRYAFGINKLLGEARSNLKWADGKQVKCEFEVQILHLLGPKTDADRTGAANASLVAKQPAARGKPAAVAAAANGNAEVFREETRSLADQMISGDAAKFHKPGENYLTDGYVMTPRTRFLLGRHLEQTGGKVFTRFPPEPNGILHIGHAKAINFNFGYARAHNGHCYLRYDDTNPEKEEEKFFVAIRDIVEWLGYTPYKVTYASDNFDQLYEWAESLIMRGKAYVCHQSPDQLKGHNPPPSPWRDRPAEESLQLFRAMRAGMYAEGEACLRMRLTMEDSKQDPVAYRIKYARHHRTGSKWCIYPTYDYTHCLCDSIENITHSLCTKEFQNRRSSYYWLCNALDLYCPVQWEYGRLNVCNTVMSKRKILNLVQKKAVADWDDPRLFTLTALRRRGVPPEAVNLFAAKVGVTMASAYIDPSLLDACTREILNTSAPRTMVVLDPLKVTIVEGLDAVKSAALTVPDYPASPERGSHSIASFSASSGVLYLEREDFRDGGKAGAGAGFKRLTEDQPVGLKHANVAIAVRQVVRNAAGQVSELRVACLPLDSLPAKPKCFVHWVADPVQVEVRLYEQLFTMKNPEEHPDGLIAAMNPNSLAVKPGALADRYLLTAAAIQRRLQFERLGYFYLDQDSSPPGRLIFNRTVTLKEDVGK